jgi:malate synthase
MIEKGNHQMLDHTGRSENHEPSVAEIVATVDKPAALKIADETFQKLRQRRSDLLEEMKLLIANKPSRGNTHRIDAEIHKLQTDAAEMVDAITEARAARAPHRRAYGAAVMTALAPYRRSAAARVLEIIAELHAAVDELAEMRVEIVRAGGEAMELPPIYFMRIEDAARIIAAGGENTGRAIGDFESMLVKSA